MKKLLLFILIILSLLLLGCEDEETVIDDPSEDKLYKEIICVEYEELKNIHVSFEGSDYFVSFKLPKEWDISKEDEIYKIKLDEKEIGKIYKGTSNDSSKWKNVRVAEKKIDDLTLYRNIDKYGTNDTLRFRHRLYFKYNDESQEGFTVEINYEEIDSSNLFTLQNNFSLRPNTSDPQMGCLGVSDPQRILIIGNSFVNSSSIYSSLMEMLSNNWKRCDVRAISRGYATVKTYAEDEDIMNEIRMGVYDAVFVCGFYTDEEVDHFSKILEACKLSETRAVVFPAHNESVTVARSAALIDEDVIFLDWKGEIDSFIKNGSSKWDFCIDDAHLHSNGLAGYVGAHMIYRAIYGECPDGSINYPVNQSYVDKKLGNYSKTGIVQNLNIDEAIIFN